MIQETLQYIIIASHPLALNETTKFIRLKGDCRIFCFKYPLALLVVPFSIEPKLICCKRICWLVRVCVVYILGGGYIAYRVTYKCFGGFPYSRIQHVIGICSSIVTVEYLLELPTEHAKLGLVKNCLNSVIHVRWLANVTILLFTITFETWYFCFSHKANFKLKGNVLFLHCWK